MSLQPVPVPLHYPRGAAELSIRRTHMPRWFVPTATAPHLSDRDSQRAYDHDSPHHMPPRDTAWIETSGNKLVPGTYREGATAGERTLANDTRQPRC